VLLAPQLWSGSTRRRSTCLSGSYTRRAEERRGLYQNLWYGRVCTSSLLPCITLTIYLCALLSGVASATDPLDSISFTEEEVKAIATTALNFGTFATAHAYTPASVMHAINAGCRGIEHGNLIDEATAKVMAEKGIFLTPTLVTYQAMEKPENYGFISPISHEKNLRVLQKGLEVLKMADDAGIHINFGTDLIGSMHEFQVRRCHSHGPSLANLATSHSPKNF
jgi:hypothetical protein